MTVRCTSTISALALCAAAAAPALAQDESSEIVVTAQRENATEITNGGAAGVLGNKHGRKRAVTVGHTGIYVHVRLIHIHHFPKCQFAKIYVAIE